MQTMSAEVRGAPVPFFSVWGMTEAAPDATLLHNRAEQVEKLY
jgi:hypothetical protein